MAANNKGITINSAKDRLVSLSNQANRLLSREGYDQFRRAHTNNIYRDIAKYFNIKNNNPDAPQITNSTAKETYLAKLLSDIDIDIINAEVKFANFFDTYGKPPNYVAK